MRIIYQFAPNDRASKLHGFKPSEIAKPNQVVKAQTCLIKGKACKPKRLTGTLRNEYWIQTLYVDVRRSHASKTQASGAPNTFYTKPN